jgi:hypothetical protein
LKLPPTIFGSLLKSEDGFSVQGAIVHLDEGLDGVVQREAFHD